MKLHQSLIAMICFIWILLFCYSVGIAQEIQDVQDVQEFQESQENQIPQENKESESGQLVEVQLGENVFTSYKERRITHGAYVGIDYEGLDLKNYISTLDGYSYTDLFGTDPISLVRLNIDYKYNTEIGALAFGIDLGKGSITNDLIGEKRTLDITKYGFGFKIVADMFMNEPYAAPYFGINLWQMTISEESPAESFSATTQLGYNYSLGVLLQLDWLDMETAKNTTFNWGLENTFLDVYVTQYAQTTAPDDPNTETDFLFGGGVRLEF